MCFFYKKSVLFYYWNVNKVVKFRLRQAQPDNCQLRIVNCSKGIPLGKTANWKLFIAMQLHFISKTKFDNTCADIFIYGFYLF